MSETPDKREDELDPFFPERGQNRLALESQLICLSCPVYQDCVEYSEKVKPRYGIWAGKRYSPG